MDMFKALPGDMVLSKIDLKNGAVGFVPEDWEDVAVTGHFAVYRLDASRLLPGFLHRLIQTDFFKLHLWRHKVGAEGRKEVKLDFFESVAIPLPLIVVQEAIVNNWQTAIAEAARAEAQAAQLEKQAQTDFLHALGLRAAEELKPRRAFAVHWSAIGRWGAALNQTDGRLDVADGKYPVARLADLIADLENGWSPKCLDRPAEKDEWSVLKLGAVSFGTFNPRQNKALPATLKPDPRIEVKPGDWLMSRANIARLVGACALVQKDVPARLILCDKIFRAVWQRDQETIALPAYLDAALKIQHLRQQIESALTGTSPTMKNISKPSLLALRLPCPPVDVQKNLVQHLNSAQQSARNHRAQASQLRATAKREIEAALLGEALPTAETAQSDD